MLDLVESFLSIQGEGKYCGKVAVFFRFAGCNLKCIGFNSTLKSLKTGEMIMGCDTIRAVATAHFSYQKITSYLELVEILNSYKLNYKPIIVITGGEPLIHHKNPIFYDFISYLLSLNYSVHFETNGTIEIDFLKFPNYKSCVFCISPKLSNSNEKKDKRLNFKALKSIKDNALESFYKFVIDSKFDYEKEIDEILSEVENETFCMPLGKNQEELSKNDKECIKFCIKKGYNYTDRLHIRIFNDKDGV